MAVIFVSIVLPVALTSNTSAPNPGALRTYFVLVYFIMLVGIADMWYMVLRHQPFRVFGDRVEPGARRAVLGLRRQRLSISVSDIAACRVVNWNDSWGRPAGRTLFFILRTGREEYVPTTGKDADDVLIGFLKQAGVSLRVETTSPKEEMAKKAGRRSGNPH